MNAISKSIYFIEHSDDWAYKPPVPKNVYTGWYVSNNEGEPSNGPFKELADAIDCKKQLDEES